MVFQITHLLELGGAEVAYANLCAGPMVEELDTGLVANAFWDERRPTEEIDHSTYNGKVHQNYRVILSDRN